MPLFSIIIPTCERLNLLEDCLNSVLNQSFADWEVIVVDNGNNGEDIRLLTAQINDNRIRYFCTDTKYDRSIARNAGLAYSKGEFICFVDDDDLLLPEYLSTFKNWFDTHPKQNRSILRCAYAREKSGKRTLGPIYSVEKHKNPVRFAAFNMCGIWTLCIPKQCMEGIQFPSGFPHWQDTHVILRLLSRYPMYQLPDLNYIYKIHDDMGSLAVKKEKNPADRLHIHLAAIDDFFLNYSSFYKPFLPKNAHRMIKAEKYLQYATADLLYFKGDNSWQWFAKSIQLAFVPKIWKSYLVFIKLYFKKLLKLL